MVGAKKTLRDNVTIWQEYVGALDSNHHKWNCGTKSLTNSNRNFKVSQQICPCSYHHYHHVYQCSPAAQLCNYLDNAFTFSVVVTGRFLQVPFSNMWVPQVSVWFIRGCHLVRTLSILNKCMWSSHFLTLLKPAARKAWTIYAWTRIRSLTTAMPVQCSTSRAFWPTGSRSLCGSYISP